VKRTPLIVLVLSLALGCGKSSSTPEPAADNNSAAAQPPAPELPACDFTTELKPGVPGSPGHLVKSERNPNGDSELALVMRDMLDDLQLARESLRSGTELKAMMQQHRRMLCTWPNDPSVRNGHFYSMAQKYLAALKGLGTETGDRLQAFNAVVDQCIQCHDNTCPGPRGAIRKLHMTPL